MGSLMFLRWVYFIVVLVDLQMALGFRWGERIHGFPLLHGGVRGAVEEAAPPPPLWEGLCKACIIPAGYKCQDFQVKSQDGYILGLQRIPEHSSETAFAQKKPPVLVQHGVLVDGMSWLMGCPNESLVYVLVNSGFDVWISNTRGTRFSNGHESLSSNQPKYWNWSWDEVAQYDLPAMCDFIYQQTGQKLHYIGHSMGSLTALAALSQGKLVDKLASVSLLSPIAYLSYMTTIAGGVSADAFMGELGEIMGLAKFDPGAIITAMKFIPGGSKLLYQQHCTPFIKELWASAYLDEDPSAFFSEILPKPMVFDVGDEKLAFRNLVVRKYDYTPQQNMEHYGNPDAPVYNLKNISKDLPLFISYGGSDQLADPYDVKLLLKDLSSHDTDKLKVHFCEDYGHMDYVLGYNNKVMIYDHIITFMRQHAAAESSSVNMHPHNNGPRHVPLHSSNEVHN